MSVKKIIIVYKKFSSEIKKICIPEEVTTFLTFLNRGFEETHFPLFKVI